MKRTNETTWNIEDNCKRIAIGGHGVKLHKKGWLIIYETLTGGDSVLLEAAQTSGLVAFLEAHRETFQGDLETPYHQELHYPGGSPPTVRSVYLYPDGRLVLFDGATSIELMKQEDVADLYSFLQFQKKS